MRKTAEKGMGSSVIWCALLALAKLMQTSSRLFPSPMGGSMTQRNLRYLAGEIGDAAAAPSRRGSAARDTGNVSAEFSRKVVANAGQGFVAHVFYSYAIHSYLTKYVLSCIARQEDS